LSTLGGSCSLVPCCTTDPDIWVNASSSWGIGLVVKEYWSAWHLLLGWDHDDRDISWAKSVALKLAILWLVRNRFSDCNVMVRGDNMGFIGEFNKGRLWNASHNATIRRMASCLVPFNILLVPVYVSSENRADSVSCSILGPHHLCLGFAFKLPSELSPFLPHV